MHLYTPLPVHFCTPSPENPIRLKSCAKSTFSHLHLNNLKVKPRPTELQRPGQDSSISMCYSFLTSPRTQRPTELQRPGQDSSISKCYSFLASPQTQRPTELQRPNEDTYIRKCYSFLTSPQTQKPTASEAKSG